MQIQLSVNDPVVPTAGFNSRRLKVYFRKPAGVENIGTQHCRLNFRSCVARKVGIQNADLTPS